MSPPHVPKLRTKLNFSLKQGMRPEAENGAPSWPGDSRSSHPVRVPSEVPGHQGSSSISLVTGPYLPCQEAQVHLPECTPAADTAERGLCRPTKPAPVRRTSAQRTFICTSSKRLLRGQTAGRTFLQIGNTNRSPSREAFSEAVLSPAASTLLWALSTLPWAQEGHVHTVSLADLALPQKKQLSKLKTFRRVSEGRHHVLTPLLPTTTRCSHDGREARWRLKLPPTQKDAERPSRYLFAP